MDISWTLIFDKIYRDQCKGTRTHFMENIPDDLNYSFVQ